MIIGGLKATGPTDPAPLSPPRATEQRREVFLGTEESTGRQFMVEKFWIAGEVVEERVSTRPNPESTWAPPIVLHPVAIDRVGGRA